MLFLIGQVARDAIEREAFQEVDFRRMFGQLAKWVAQIDDAARIPELVSRAFHTATAGPPGPVVLALPEDMLAERADVADVPRYRPVQPHPAPDDVADVQARLERAAAPVRAGRAARPGRRGRPTTCAPWPRPTACRSARRSAARTTSTTARRRYVGDVGLGINPALARARPRGRPAARDRRAAGRVDDLRATRWSTSRVPRQELVHVHADPEELGRVYAPALGDLRRRPRAFLAAARALPALDGAALGRRDRRGARRVRGAGSTPTAAARRRQPRARSSPWLAETLPDDAIVTNGAGNYTVWLHRFYRYRRFRTQLGADVRRDGLRAARRGRRQGGAPRPHRRRVRRRRLLPDGRARSSPRPCSTSLPIVVVVANNGMYGTIRMHQERHYPGRVSAPTWRNPDFAALARAYGAHGETDRARPRSSPRPSSAPSRSGRPALLALRVDPEALTPAATLSATRERALAAAR